MRYRDMQIHTYLQCLHIHEYTCTNMLIHTIPQQPKLEMVLSLQPMISLRRAKEHNYQLITIGDQQIVLVWGTFNSFAATWLSIKNWSRGSSLGHQTPDNKQKSAYADASCTMRVGRRLGQVWACLGDPDRFYGSRKTGQHMKSFKGVILDAP